MQQYNHVMKWLSVLTVPGNKHFTTICCNDLQKKNQQKKLCYKKIWIEMGKFQGHQSMCELVSSQFPATRHKSRRLEKYGSCSLCGKGGVSY
jgi:hypothetical protein